MSTEFKPSRLPASPAAKPLEVRGLGVEQAPHARGSTSSVVSVSRSGGSSPIWAYDYLITYEAPYYKAFGRSGLYAKDTIVDTIVASAIQSMPNWSVRKRACHPSGRPLAPARRGLIQTSTAYGQ